MFVGGFNQKTINVDLFVKVNHVFSRRKQLQKVLEDTRGLSTKDDHERMTWGGWPAPPIGQLAYGTHGSTPPRYVDFPPR